MVYYDYDENEDGKLSVEYFQTNPSNNNCLSFFSFKSQKNYPDASSGNGSLRKNYEN